MKNLIYTMAAFVAFCAVGLEATTFYVNNKTGKDVYFDYMTNCGGRKYAGARVQVADGQNKEIKHDGCSIYNMRVYSQASGGKRLDGEKGTIRFEDLDGNVITTLEKEGIGANMHNWTFNLVLND